MYDRLQAAKSLHSTKGVSVLAIDDAQFRELSFVAQAVGFEALGVFCIRANPSGRPMQTGYSVSHEYNIVLGASGTAAIGRMRPTESQQARFNQTDDKGSFEWRNLRREGSNSDRSARPALYYPIYLRLPDSIRVPKMSWNPSARSWSIEEQPEKGEIVIFPNDDEGKEKTWRWEWRKVVASKEDLAIRLNGKGKEYVYVKRRPNGDGVSTVSSWFDAKYSSVEHGTAIVKDLFGDKTIFSRSCKTISSQHNDA